MSWQLEEDFVTEETNFMGFLVRRNSKSELHSLYSPAIECSRLGSRHWYQNNLPHRLDGPAYELCDGHKEWYYEGKCYGSSFRGYNQEQFLEELKREGKI